MTSKALLRLFAVIIDLFKNECDRNIMENLVRIFLLIDIKELHLLLSLLPAIFMINVTLTTSCNASISE